MKNKSPKKSKVTNAERGYVPQSGNSYPGYPGPNPTIYAQPSGIRVEPIVEPPPTPGTMIVRGGTTAGKPGDIATAVDRWRENYNPLRGLTMQRAVELLELGQRGDTAYLQWCYRFIERRVGVIPSLIASCEAPIAGFAWKVKIKDGLGDDQLAMAKAQQETLTDAYAAIDNLKDAILHLHMADFRGYSHVQKHRNADGDVYHLECLDQWCVCRDGLNGNWWWNPRSRQTSSPLAFLGAPFCIGGEQLPLQDFIIREVNRPIDEMAITYAVRWLMFQADWTGFIKIYGVPSGVVTLPPNINTAFEEAYAQAAKRISEAGSGALPFESKYQANDSPRGTDPFTPFSNYLDQIMVMCGTGGKLTMLSASGSGTLAGSAHADTFNTIAALRASQISACFQRQFDQEILANQHEDEPTLVYFCLEGNPTGVSDLCANVAKLAPAGYKADVQWLNEQTGYELEDAPVAPLPGTEPDADTEPVRNRRVKNKLANPDDNTPLVKSGILSVAAALAPDVETLNNRLAQCLEGDPDLIVSRLKDFNSWLAKNAAHFARNPKLADAMQETISAAFANGLGETQ